VGHASADNSEKLIECTCCLALAKVCLPRVACGIARTTRVLSFSAWRALKRRAERFSGTAVEPAASVGACMAVFDVVAALGCGT
jgi:hypothetical protein